MAPDYEDLHALALRLITPYDPLNPAAEPLLFVGQLPPDLPVELPLPPIARLWAASAIVGKPSLSSWIARWPLTTWTHFTTIS